MKICIAGAGAIARRHHIPALRAQGNRVTVAAVHDLDCARASEFARDFRIARVYATLEEMVVAEKPDLVHICTPPSCHAPMAIFCLTHGANVLCEKPICASLAELDLINEAERRSGKQCAVVSQSRFGSSIQHVRGQLISGMFGRPLVASCNTAWFRDHAYYQVPWRGKWSNELGGAVVSQGIHAIDRVLYLLGDWESVFAVTRTLDRDIEVEDTSAAVVLFKNGCVCTMINSVLCPREESQIRIDCQNGTIELRHLYEFNNSHWQFTPAPGHECAIAQCGLLPLDRPANHAAQIDVLLDDLASGRPHLMTGTEIWRTMELVTAMFKSSATERPVRAGSVKRNDRFYHGFSGSRPQSNSIVNR